jgi:hypothetical protein
MNTKELLGIALKEERDLTAAWYARMSGEVPWMPGRREMFSAKFEELSQRIRTLQGEDTAQWFAELP